MRVAIVHDWLTGLRGGEKCLQAFLKIYPAADIFTLLHVPGTTDAEIDARVVKRSFINYLPYSKSYYRLLLPFFPIAINQFDLSGYDLVISLSHAAAKNVHVPSGAVHVCYCFTPMRYIWDQAHAYFGSATYLLWPLIQALRAWDRKGAERVDTFVAISRFVAGRIRCFYKKQAKVIFPPLDAGWITARKDGETGEAYLCAGALVPYKKVYLAVEAFNRLGSALWIVGTGPEEAKLRRAAKPNIQFFGHLPQAQLAERLKSCRALIFPGTEDFGLVPVECMAAGRPVIGLLDGGLRETVNGLKPWINSSLAADRASGVFIQKKRDKDSQVRAIMESVRSFESVEGDISARSCISQSRLFSQERFLESWRLIEKSI